MPTSARDIAYAAYLATDRPIAFRGPRFDDDATCLVADNGDTLFIGDESDGWGYSWATYPAGEPTYPDTEDAAPISEVGKVRAALTSWINAH